MTPDELKQLTKNDKIRHKATGHVFMVNRTKPEITALREVAVTNPLDWERIAPDEQDKAGQRFSLEGRSVYDSHTKNSVSFEDLATAEKMLAMLQSGEIEARQLDWITK